MARASTDTRQPPGAPQGMSQPKQKTARDPRYLALRNFAISISVLNIFGYTLLGFEQAWIFPVFSVLTAYVTDIVLETVTAWAGRRRPRYLGGMRSLYEFLLPAHITALAVNMLLYTNNQIGPVIFGAMVGVSGKYIFQAPINGKMRHFMNPSNLGIAAVLIIFSRWVAIGQPYEFVENANEFFKIMVPIIILTAGTVLNATLTKRTALIVGFMGGFAIQAFFRHWVWDVSLFSALGVMTNVPFVLFANYMISDPGTTPTKPRPQFMFGGTVAFVYGALMEANIVYTLIFATAIVCAVRGGGWWAVHFYNRYRARRGRSRGPAAVVPANTAGAAPFAALQPRWGGWAPGRLNGAPGPAHAAGAGNAAADACRRFLGDDLARKSPVRQSGRMPAMIC
jgi:enediyne biosynthesis protein E5